MKLPFTLRVAAPSIGISLLLLAVGGFGGWYILNLQKSMASLIALDMSTLRAAEQLALSITEVRELLAGYLADSDHAHLQAIPDRCEHIERWLRESESLADDNEE